MRASNDSGSPLQLGSTRIALAIVAVALPIKTVISQGGPDQPEFFTAVPAGQQARFIDVPGAVRQRNVRLDLDLLRDDRHSRDPVDGLTFSLFEDTVVSGDVQGIDLAYGGGYVVELSLDQDPHGYAYLSVMRDSMTATIRVHGRLYQVHAVGIGGQHTISEVDETQRLPCGTPDPVPIGIHGVQGAPLPATTSEVLDVMVVYTDDARATYGINGVQSLINGAVWETNKGYMNSDVNLRVNLVLMREVSFNETGTMATWVSQLRNVDGVIDEVHQWRDAYGADVVTMITSSSGGACGRAYRQLTVLSSAGANDAFSITASNCATGSSTFGHEVGHSLGCQHDPANTSGPALYPYCYGYHTTSQRYRTIMAYSPGSVVNYWSNPNKAAPNGEPLGAPNRAENWRVLNNVAATATAWRPHKNAGQELKTTFKSNNGFAGNMFNIRAKSDIQITSLAINTSAATSTFVQARIWYRYGTYFTASSTSAGWCSMGTASGFAAGQNKPTKLNFFGANIPTFRQGATYGIYVEYLSFGTGNMLRYTNGGPTAYENHDLRLTTGVGKATGFTGQTFPNREWNGRIWYRGGSGTGFLTTTFSGTNGYAGNMFTVTAHRKLKINSFDVHVDGSGYVTVDIWRCFGSYVGRENDPLTWLHLGTEFKALSAGLNQPTRIAISDSININTTYSYYILLSSYGSGQTLKYSSGSATYSNSDLTLGPSIGRGEGAFTGAVFSPRMWNGRINYSFWGSSEFGAGCPGTNGVPTHSQVSSSTNLGNNLVYRVQAGPTNGVGFLVLGNSNTVWTGLTLPADLGAIGASGCNAYCDHDLVIGPIALDPYGGVFQNLGIPAECRFTWADLYSQFYLLDPGANPLGLTTSNGVATVLGY